MGSIESEKRANSDSQQSVLGRLYLRLFVQSIQQLCKLLLTGSRPDRTSTTRDELLDGGRQRDLLHGDACLSTVLERRPAALRTLPSWFGRNLRRSTISPYSQRHGGRDLLGRLSRPALAILQTASTCRLRPRCRDPFWIRICTS